MRLLRSAPVGANARRCRGPTSGSLAPLARLERATRCLEGSRSIQTELQGRSENFPTEPGGAGAEVVRWMAYGRRGGLQGGAEGGRARRGNAAAGGDRRQAPSPQRRARRVVGPGGAPRGAAEQRRGTNCGLLPG